MTRTLRPIFLTVLLAGMALTLVMAPSALQAQQAPPGSAPATGYGAAPNHAQSARDIALGKLGGGSTNAVWWIVAVVVALLLIGAAVALYLRRES
ncbi:MAG: hypothetical protein DLM65_08330 [Candidatus Aeolococcus gillhamiae]|uniref:Gram-positive cocci surface proteins LPxTG domain-containing protein n=1 Tax=Candidatus Aeolococcus gillhamiae TaxID=3127015 RepID=A0A2W6AA11_9BACT|nr:MAG: hypothetical protein DLM65_08330 [Candidatus Dormibacter sp. RRmetagenome_bin12]